jgi:ketosteroid isomerase-like protein
LRKTGSNRDHRRVPSRAQLIQAAFDAFAAGDLTPLEALFDPDAEWVGIPGGGWEGGTSECAGRSTIVDRFKHHYSNGRRFTAEEFIERGDRVAVGVTIHNPTWSSPVKVFKVFTFKPDENVVVRLNDCIDESYARQALAA